MLDLKETILTIFRNYILLSLIELKGNNYYLVNYLFPYFILFWIFVLIPNDPQVIFPNYPLSIQELILINTCFYFVVAFNLFKLGDYVIMS